MQRTLQRPFSRLFLIAGVTLFVLVAAACSSEPNQTSDMNHTDTTELSDASGETSPDASADMDADTGDVSDTTSAVCLGVTCSGNGVCIGDDVAACSCNPGFHAEGLDCIADDCVPEPRDRFSCDDGDIYWYDSCGSRETLKEACADGCQGTLCNPPADGVLRLRNFEVSASNPARIHFDSTVPLTGSTTDGFSVPTDLTSNTPSNEPHFANSITAVHIEAGQTSGHYFTLNHAYVYGDNVLINYVGGADLQDIAGVPLRPFSHQRVPNRIPEPSYTGSTYFVDAATGDDNDDGLSETDAWATIRHAAQVADAGDVVYVKAGTYGGERVVFANSGRADARILFEGYTSTPGDNPQVPWEYGGQGLDSSVMPLLDGGNRDAGTAIDLFANDNSYITLRNLQITNYAIAVRMRNSRYLLIENILAENFGLDGYSGHGFSLTGIGYNNTFRDVVIENATATGFRLYGYFNAIIDSKVYCDEYNGDAGGTQEPIDYYTTIRGDWNYFGGLHLEKVGDLEHGGHGITFKGDRDLGFEIGSVANNLAENSTIIHINGSVELRHRMVQFNTVRNIHIDINPAFATGRTGGIDIRDGASDNIVENSVINGVKDGISFFDSSEDQGDQSIGHDNIIRNSVFTNVDRVVRMDSNYPTDNMTGNRILHCTIHNVPTLFGGSPAGDTSDNVFIGNIVSNVDNIGSDVFGQSHSNYFGGASAPAGTQNISADPLFEDAMTGNFHLSTGSPCVDAGTALPDVHFDADGRARPLGNANDLGAFELE